MRTIADPLTHHYFDRHLEMDGVKLLPGGYYVTARNILLATVLGSCVSACIRDRRTGVGGMNHFMLPEAADADPLAASARYGVHAMEMLLNELAKAGASRGALEAKVFGGGSVIAGMTTSEVGKRNAAFVLQFLATEGIEVVAQDLGDIYPRKIQYFPRTGKVMVKKLREIHNSTIEQRERDYRRRLKVEDVEGEVELFA